MMIDITGTTDHLATDRPITGSASSPMNIDRIFVCQFTFQIGFCQCVVTIAVAYNQYARAIGLERMEEAVR